MKRLAYHSQLQTIGLESKAERELHLPGREGARRGSKRRTDVISAKIEGHRIDGAELCVIEDVVDFPSEREHALFAEIEVPEQSHVDISPAGSAEDVLWCISDITSAGEGNAGGIEETGVGLIVVPKVRVALQVDSLGVSAAQ